MPRQARQHWRYMLRKRERQGGASARALLRGLHGGAEGRGGAVRRCTIHEGDFWFWDTGISLASTGDGEDRSGARAKHGSAASSCTTGGASTHCCAGCTVARKGVAGPSADAERTSPSDCAPSVYQSIA